MGVSPIAVRSDIEQRRYQDPVARHLVSEFRYLRRETIDRQATRITSCVAHTANPLAVPPVVAPPSQLLRDKGRRESGQLLGLIGQMLVGVDPQKTATASS